jgi:hypothetical protein
LAPSQGLAPGHLLAAGADSSLAFFDETGFRLDKYTGANPSGLVALAGGYGLAGGGDAPTLRVLKQAVREDFFRYDAAYSHTEARVRADGQRVLLYSHTGFRLYDGAGALLAETLLPQPDRVTDQQYARQSGNLLVLYPDALRVYAGADGALLLEKTGLRSVFYAPYGVSVLDGEGGLYLVDPDTAQAEWKGGVAGAFGAFCGEIIDDKLLAGRRLLGAGQGAEGRPPAENYLYALGDETAGAVYDGTGLRFSLETPGPGCEVFFTPTLAVAAPLHGTTRIYSLATGQKLRDLDESYYTYVTQAGDRLVAESLQTDGSRLGELLDLETCQTRAALPWLTDVTQQGLVFDDRRGVLRRSRVYSIEALRALAEEALAAAKGGLLVQEK